MRPCSCLLVLALAGVLGSPAPARAQGATAEAAGIVFETLSPADLDVIKDKTGYRLGVAVREVKPNTPGAASGLKPTDVIFAVGKTGVDSAEKAAAALRAAAGEVELPGLTIVNGAFEVRTFRLRLEGAAGVAPEPPADGATTDPVTAYFDLMDFVRSEAWGHSVQTSAAERARVAAQLQGLQLDQQSAAALEQLPAAWAAVRTQWQQADAAQREKQRGQWRTQLLLPGGLYPPPPNPQQYTAPQNLLSFQYPAGWTGGTTESNGTPLLWLGPAGGQAQWEQVLDTPRSPAGALLALAEVSPELRNLSYVQGAHYLARLLIPGGVEGLKVVNELPLADIGAVITLVGKFAGQEEERFYWIGVAKFGDTQVLAGRLGGPVKDADALVPAFTYMLQTLQLNPPQAAGGGASGAWEAAWSRVSVGIVKNIWAPGQ